MPKYVNVSGVWRTVKDDYMNVGGVWKLATNGYVNVSGVWRQFLTPPDPVVVSTVGYNTVVIPSTLSARYTRVFIKCWGSGGGGGGLSNGGGGGSGGYVKGTLTITPGETLHVFIPNGGFCNDSTNTIGAGGGSWAGVFRNSGTTWTPLIIAGGGGGGGGGRSSSGGNGGAGGGLTAGASNFRGGGGGTQSAGGAGGIGDSVGGAGSYLTGGDAYFSSGVGNGFNGAATTIGSSYGQGGDFGSYQGDHASGGGGGAGYYGGGGGGNGGNSNNSGGGGGGGGSSYVGGVTNATNTIGSIGNYTSDVLPPNTTDIDYISGIGVGRRNAQTTRGGQGLVVIRFVDA